MKQDGLQSEDVCAQIGGEAGTLDAMYNARQAGWLHDTSQELE